MKTILTILLLLPFISQGQLACGSGGVVYVKKASTAIAFVSDTFASSATSSVTTSAINTSTANFICIGVIYLTSTTITLTDNYGNTWVQDNAKSFSNAFAFYHCSPCTVGNAQTFTASGGDYNSIYVASFSGVASSSPLDQQAYNSAAASTLTMGSITPSVNGELIIGFCTGYTAAPIPTISSGYNILHSNGYVPAVYFNGGMFYRIQTTATAVAPTFSFVSTDNLLGFTFTFKP